jgi:hypothetical protein
MRRIPVQPSFPIRNYKHEIHLKQSGPRSVLDYTDEVWETLCRRIAAHGFNGLVLYPDTYHPFEHILDYGGFPQAATQPARVRGAKRAALARGLAIAHRHGLRTFMQHYASHVPDALARHLKLGATGGNRMADLVHPEIDRYARWCYRETFAQIPDLDGLYFNFESSQDMRHVEATAVREFNRMSRKPVAVWRVWGLESPEGLRRVVAAYRGPSILCHKGSDTNDVYYLPVADSRVRDWKRVLPGVPFIHEVGPCHNCATNLQGQLWADYDYVQELLADAARKNADGISFHAVNEFFAPDVRTPGVFGEAECDLARLNTLHVTAAADFFVGRRRSRAARAAALAERNGVPRAAGDSLLEAVEASSQLVLLAFRQFCYGSAFEGVTNPGWYSHIQEPFYFWPATELNGQSRRLMWRPECHMPWIHKRAPADVCPGDAFQYILDEADPARPPARMPPRRIASELDRQTRRADAAVRRFERLAGRAQTAALRRYVAHNALLAECVRHEILAARALYALYFARQPRRLRDGSAAGLRHLRRLTALLACDPGARKSLDRVFMIRLDPAGREVPPVRELARVLRRPGLPAPAFAAYVESHRHYNEIRRTVRPQRLHTPATLAVARAQLTRARAAATDALTLLSASGDARCSARVREWIAFLDHEQRHMRPPRARCDAAPGASIPLVHDHCFRNGEYFADDFLGFFRPVDWLRHAGLSFRVWHTASALVVAVREDGVDVADRLARWEEFAGSGSDCFVTRIHVDSAGQGRTGRLVTVYPRGSAVTLNRSPDLPSVHRTFETGNDWWETTVWLPFRLIGGPPRNGDVWGFNVTANPFIRRGTCYTWAAQYDCDNPRLYGRLTFASRAAARRDRGYS